MIKGRFLVHRRSKLQFKGDGPFQVIEWINNNAYKMDLIVEYDINVTFNIYDLSLFDVSDDLR